MSAEKPPIEIGKRYWVRHGGLWSGRVLAVSRNSQEAVFRSDGGYDFLVEFAHVIGEVNEEINPPPRSLWSMICGLFQGGRKR